MITHSIIYKCDRCSFEYHRKLKDCFGGISLSFELPSDWKSVSYAGDSLIFHFDLCPSCAHKYNKLTVKANDWLEEKIWLNQNQT